MLSRIAICFIFSGGIMMALGQELNMNSAAVEIASRELNVEPAQLEVERVPNRFFQHWIFWRITDGMMPPRIIYVATRGNEAEKITLSAGLATQLTSENVSLSTARDALAF